MTASPTIGTAPRVSLRPSLTRVALLAAGAGLLCACGADTAPPMLSVTPPVAALTVTRTVQFHAEWQGAVVDVDWTVDDLPGGDAGTGTITVDGLYTPPARAGRHRITAARRGDTGLRGTAAAVVTDHPGVFTYHNDDARTGQNRNETVLSPATVSPARFGKLAAYPVDGPIYAQPLYVANLRMPDGFHNVVYVATQHDSVYAFDADGGSPTPLWQAKFADPAAGITPLPCADQVVECAQVLGSEVGITGTPVISISTSTLMVSAHTKENGRYIHRLHALDLTTGAEVAGSPVVIAGSFPGAGDKGDMIENGRIVFNPYYQLQRAGLALANGVVYVPFASFATNRPYHGWLFGIDTRSWSIRSVFNTTPGTWGGSVWQAGCAPAIDADGNLFFLTGNGHFDADRGGKDYGDSFVKMARTETEPGVAVLDYFTPHDQARLDELDLDLGSGGAVLLPDAPGRGRLVIGGGKEGTLYLVNRDDMGGFNATDDSQIVQSVPKAVNSIFSTLAFWRDSIYIAGWSDTLRQYVLEGNHLVTPARSQAQTMFGFPGATPSVSANGDSDGIVWVVEGTWRGTPRPAILHAYDASDVSRELYRSDQAEGRDTLGRAVSFAVPTVVNGRVYVGTGTELDILGLLPR